jgi:dienelactone hydrolase
VSLPSTSGRYAVGRRTFYVLDSARTDPHAIRADGKREFMMIVWYPAVPGNVLSRSAWLPAAWEDSAATDMFAQTRRASPPPTIEVVRATIRSTTSRSRDSAAVSPGAEKFPVLIFSPGNVVMPSYYASIAEELASHGYVVIGHVPTGYSRNVVLPDGRVFPRRDYADIDPWIGDVRYIVDHLSRWNADPVYPLFHRLDTLRIGLYGHSGGANAVEVVSSSDSRVRAIAALDPGLTDTAWATSKPTLFLLAENKALFARDTALSSSVARERRDFARHAGNAFWITIRGTEHMSFADISAIPAFQLSADGPAHIAASRRVLLEFFDESLRGVRSNVLREAGAREAFIRVDKP